MALTVACVCALSLLFSHSAHLRLAADVGLGLVFVCNLIASFVNAALACEFVCGCSNTVSCPPHVDSCFAGRFIVMTLLSPTPDRDVGYPPLYSAFGLGIHGRAGSAIGSKSGWSPKSDAIGSVDVDS